MFILVYFVCFVGYAAWAYKIPGAVIAATLFVSAYCAGYYSRPIKAKLRAHTRFLRRRP
jgi:hypothetical protein